MGRPCSLGPISKSAIRTKRCRERQKQNELDLLDLVYNVDEVVQGLQEFNELLQEQIKLLEERTEQLREYYENLRVNQQRYSEEASTKPANVLTDTQRTPAIEDRPESQKIKRFISPPIFLSFENKVSFIP
ncbi:hypothetical protein L596_012059 [Steinernema carpocapsae]|uniref:Uncharacterized protein n=1 Tax=Steinernema carpocapsae TaxID=34508 RepID=A0A4U5NWQ1_STECR|nr:hypothetical protein L596_012059 [Steinernema carpocapsae]